jgi:hypothetical protein
MHPAANRDDGLFRVNQYFPLRYVPNIDLVEEPGDQFDYKCRG